LFFAFIYTIITQQRILSWFIYFQTITPYEQLDQKRMEYNVEERKFIKRIWFQLIGVFIVFLSIAAYMKWVYDGRAEYRTYVPLLGAMFSAFLT
jgi:hypothetical protein